MGSHNCGSRQIQNIQGRPAGWRPRKELQIKSEGNLLAEFPHFGGQSVIWLRPSTDGMRAPTLWKTIFFTQSL